jgi:hypothetical protein
VYKPTSREAALLLLHAIEERGDRRDSELTRARLSRVTLKRLWIRENLSEPWLAEVNDWLLSAGWTLLHAGTTFGVVKKSVVENWPRVSSKHIQDVLDQVGRGEFDFSRLEDLLGATRATQPRSKIVAGRRTRKPKVKE